MSQLPQRFDHQAVKILVGVESGHDRSSLFVSTDSSFDLRRMRLHIGPGSSQIILTERRIVVQKFVIRKAQPARLLQGPDRNARVGDACITATDTRRVFDASRPLFVPLLDEQQKIQHLHLHRLRGRLQLVQKRGVQRVHDLKLIRTRASCKQAIIVHLMGKSSITPAKNSTPRLDTAAPAAPPCIHR